MHKARFAAVALAVAVVCALGFGCSSPSAQSSSAPGVSGAAASASSSAASPVSAASEATTSASAASSTSASASAASASASASAASSGAAAVLEDGRYDAKFNTDSSMFHVNEADGGMGVLTVENGEMSMHIRLASKKIVNLYPGTKDQASEDGANVIEPVSETVTYSDGYEEEVYAFDVPVPAVGEEFSVAILGEKGKWYDHKVSVTDPELQD